MPLVPAAVQPHRQTVGGRPLDVMGPGPDDEVQPVPGVGEAEVPPRDLSRLLVA